MTGYDFNRPYVDSSTLPVYNATDPDESAQYGRTVRATRMSNSEYGSRFSRMSKSNNMKAPPSHQRIFDGYLVVRKLGTTDQYETWMPIHVFEEIYEAQK